MIRLITFTLFIFFAAVWFLLNSVHLQTYIGSQTSIILSEKIGYPVKIDRVAINLPTTIHLINVKVGPEENPILEVEQIKLNFPWIDILWSNHLDQVPDYIPFTAYDAKYKKISIPTLEGLLNLDLSIKQGSISITALVETYPFTFSSQFSPVNNDHFSLQNIQIDALGIAIKGDLIADLTKRWVQGKLSILSSPLNSLMFNDVKGTITFNEDYSILGDLLAHKTSIESVKAEEIHIKTYSENILKNGSTRFSLDGNEITLDDLTINRLNIDGVYTLSHNLELNIKTFQGNFQEHTFSIDQDVLLTIADDQSIQLPNLQLKCDIHNPYQFIKVNNIPILVSTSITGSLKHPKLQMNFKNLVIPTTFSQLEIDLSTKFDESGLSVEGSFNIPHTPQINFNATIPLILTLMPYKLNDIGNLPLSGRITSKGDIGPLYQLLLYDDTLLSGITELNLFVLGTANTPYLKGICTLIDGHFEINALGTTLQNLNAEFEIANTDIQLVKVHAEDDNEGTVSGTGHILLDTTKNLPFHLDLDITNVALVNIDDIKASASGLLTFSGTSGGGDITAQLKTQASSINIPEQPSSLTNYVEVTFINTPENTPPPISLAQVPSTWPISMNINLNIPENLNISSKELTSQWKGDLSIQGTVQNLLYFGTIRVIKGEYLFNGKPFEINQGSVTAAGELDKKTSLYVIATKDLDEVIVDVIVKGSIKNPSISFRSNPALPQREILSWLLFDRGTSEISPFQGSQLSESISNLDRSQQGPDVLTKIRTALGIDRFDFTRNSNTEEGGVDFKVGKYISDNVLISINKSSVNSVSVETSLAEKFKLQAQIGDDAEAQILLNWKRDY